MRRSCFTSAVILFACGGVACAAAPYASNSTKMTEAAAFVGAAAVAQVIEPAAEARARNRAPVSHSSSGVVATPDCDNDG